jgi:hypothetical protein
MPTLSTPPPPANSPTRIRPGRRNALRQALELQRRVYEDAIKPDVRAADLAQLVRGWDTLENRKRILRGRPLPGSLKPKPKEPRGSGFRSNPLYCEPLDAEPVGVSPADAENSEEGAELLATGS